jgi:phenylalanine-4-hydroxylase
MTQEYEKYTAEDFAVWKILFERQIAQLPGMATDEYLEGIKRVAFTADRIPRFEEVTALLAKYTGWKLHVVPGLIPNKEFFELMKARNFCATTWLRRMDQLDYLEEPDMFHDVFGHVPLLTNEPLCDFLVNLSRIALRYIDSELAIELVSRIYWYTVEFGLIQEEAGLRIYGAGILSSKAKPGIPSTATFPSGCPTRCGTSSTRPTSRTGSRKNTS